MGIANRDKDASEKQYSVSKHYEGFVTSETKVAHLVGHPSKLKSAWIAAKGLSGVPGYQLQARRWTSAGVTVIPLAAVDTVAIAFGTSGSAVEVASSLIALQTEDLIEVVSSVANTAADDVCIAMVFEALQDIKEEFGATS